MKPSEVYNLKKSIKLIQVFRNASLFAKGEKIFEKGRDWLSWPDQKSPGGFVKDGTLYLPNITEDIEGLNKYTMLFLLDDFSSNEKDKLFNWKSSYHLFTQSSSSIGIDFLQIKNEEELSIFFNGPNYTWYPKRTATFKLAELKKGKPVEIKLNGKSDGHHQRYYFEEQFLFDYLGDFSSFTMLPHNATPALKKVPTDKKTVDLRELIW